MATIFLGVVLGGLVPLEQQWRDVQSKPENPKRLVEESRLLYYLGSQDPENSKTKWSEGREKAEAARKVPTSEPGATFWWAANLGALARAEKNLAALGKIVQIEKALLELKRSYPTYGYAAADRVLGKIYSQAPRFISIGSTSEAESHMKAALAAAPEYPGNHLNWLEFLVEEERWDAARTALAEAKRVPWDKDFGAFNPDKLGWASQLKNIETALERKTH